MLTSVGLQRSDRIDRIRKVELIESIVGRVDRMEWVDGIEGTEEIQTESIRCALLFCSQPNIVQFELLPAVSNPLRPLAEVVLSLQLEHPVGRKVCMFLDV